MRKNALVAFLLAFIPGAGHAYLNRMIRALVYGFGFFGPLALGLLIALVAYDDDFLILGGMAALFVYAVNLLDMIVTLIARPLSEPGDSRPDSGSAGIHSEIHSRERSTVILLSLIPGLGHLQMGLTNRGITLLGSFFGFVALVFFIVLVTANPVFLVFLILLAVLWLYGLFDAVRLMEQKSRGEEVADRSIFEDLEEIREEGRKSGMIATLLALFPGAGHMYLGQQRRGLQLMAAFLASIYFLDALRISLFLFLIPLIWFFSFFDALQQIGKYRRQALEDVPVVEYLANHQKWIGIALVLLGLFYLFDRIALPVLQQVFPNVDVAWWLESYVQTSLVALLLIVVGIRLLIGSRRQKGDRS